MIPKQPIRWCNGGGRLIGGWQEQRDKEVMDEGHHDDDKGVGGGPVRQQEILRVLRSKPSPSFFGQ
jgi:hypothetical protein